MNGGWDISYKIALRWMPLDLTDNKSTLIQVKAWCRQATSHYQSQYWPRTMSPNGATRPQWVKPRETPHTSPSQNCPIMALHYIDGLMQERCNSIANALELHLSCTNPLISLSAALYLPSLNGKWSIICRPPTTSSDGLNCRASRVKSFNGRRRGLNLSLCTMNLQKRS